MPAVDQAPAVDATAAVQRQMNVVARIAVHRRVHHTGAVATDSNAGLAELFGAALSIGCARAAPVLLKSSNGGVCVESRSTHQTKSRCPEPFLQNLLET